MKYSSSCMILFASLGAVSAFVQPAARSFATSTTSRFVLSEPDVEENVAEEVKVEAAVAVEEPVKEEEASFKYKASFGASPAAGAEETVENDGALQPGRYDNIDYSITLPFFQKPTKLDGSHAGDFGFDPMGFTEDFDIYYMQECELRHARLAMLAVVGWPLSELVAPGFMLQDGRAPSVLNGVNPISGIAILAFLAYIGSIEFFTWNRKTYDTKLGQTHLKDMKNIWDNGVAGDYNFDPAGLYNSFGDDADGRKAMRQLEVTQGRWAMLGITYFAAYEALTGYPITEDSLFFHPNVVLPILGIGYLVLSTLYEFSDLREYPIKIQKSKLGHEFDEWLERRREAA